MPGEESVYRYNLKPFAENPEILDLQRTGWTVCLFFECFRECDRIHSFRVYPAGHQPEMAQRIPDRFVRILPEFLCGDNPACDEGRML